MENPVVEVPLRKRSTPYEFIVEFRKGPGTKKLYDGKSANYARASYWQAVRLGIFLGASGAVSMTVTRSLSPYGGFETELENGKAKAAHIPSGKCVEWTTGSLRLPIQSGTRLSVLSNAWVPLDRDPVPTRQDGNLKVMATEHIVALLIEERDKLSRAIEARIEAQNGRPPQNYFTPMFTLG